MDVKLRSGTVAVAVAAAVSGVGLAFAQQPPPVVATPIVAGPEAGSPPQFPPGRGGYTGQGRGRRAWARSTPHIPTGLTVKLPAPRAKSETSLEQALWGRRTLRSITPGQITLEEAGQLLWAAQGVTGEYNRRAAPSLAGAYPLEVLLVAGDVAGLPAGVYRYYPADSLVEKVVEGDHRHEFASVTKFPQVEKAPAIIVIDGVESRLTGVVPAGAAAHNSVAIEAGAAAQNLQLEAVALGIGTAPAFDSAEAKLVQVLRLPPEEKPLVLIVISRQ